jgi:hypothetical protein
MTQSSSQIFSKKGDGQPPGLFFPLMILLFPPPFFRTLLELYLKRSHLIPVESHSTLKP